jgi:pSer/pThr/pTyr-binding forkhead associated (FHA) protein
LTVGRTADNTLAIQDPAVSGHHTRIVKVQAGFFLEDLMRTNGTDVVEQQDLKDGSQIKVAGLNLKFCVLSGTKHIFH